MAIFARDTFDTETGSRPPISAHPAFPAIVALWFATLLGLGSLILPDVLIERLVAATGIGSLIPAAHPPLGWTAYSLIAVGAAAAGAFAGLAIARQVVRAHAANDIWDEEEFTVTRQGPINVLDEIGGDGVINGRGLPVTNRRALAIAEDATADDLLYAAPLPRVDLEDSIAHNFEPDDEGRGHEPATDLEEKQWFASDSGGGDGEWSFGRDMADGDDSKSSSVDGADMIELAQRLGTSLQKRREFLAQAAALSNAASGRTTPTDLEAAAPEDAARAMAAYFGGAERTASPRSSGTQTAIPARADADAALRDALATIRRINGAA